MNTPLPLNIVLPRRYAPGFTIDIIHQKTGQLSQAQCAGVRKMYKAWHVESWRKRQSENALEMLTIPPATMGWQGGVLAGM